MALIDSICSLILNLPVYGITFEIVPLETNIKVNMKQLPLILKLIILALSTTMINCSSAQKLQKEAPAQFGEVYFQKWTAGVEGGGSGLNVFIPITKGTIELDSIYFRDNVAKLETKPQDPSVFIGRFSTDFNKAKDLILSSDMQEEAKNKLPVKSKGIPFDLKEDECVVSYSQHGKQRYYKISGIHQKPSLNYPSAPPNRQ